MTDNDAVDKFCLMTCVMQSIVKDTSILVLLRSGAAGVTFLSTHFDLKKFKQLELEKLHILVQKHFGVMTEPGWQEFKLQKQSWASGRFKHFDHGKMDISCR